MRTAALVFGLVMTMLPGLALAQNAPADASSERGRSRGGADMKRSEYIERAVERARRNAEKRFDKMDANHDGVLTADERRAARAARKSGAPAE